MSIIYGNVKPTFMEIYPDWKYITTHSPYKTVLKAGTPLGANGRIENGAKAFGLVVEATGETDNPISIVVGGVVDYAKVQAGYGNLSAAAMTALTGIRLIGSNGSVVVPSPLPSVSAADNGKVLTASNGSWIAQQPSGGGTEVLYFVMATPAYFYRDPNDYGDSLTLAQVTAALADNPTAYAFLPMDTPAAPVFGEVIMGHLVLNYFVDDATSLTLYNVDCDPENPMGGITTPHTIAYVDDQAGEVIDVGGDF